MSNDRDWRRSGRGGANQNDAQAFVPGKYSSAALLESGTAPRTSVPGRRTLTDSLGEQPMHGPLGYAADDDLIAAAPVPVANDVDHVMPVQRSATGDIQVSGLYAQRTASAGVANAGASLPHLNAIQSSFGHHDVSGVKAQVGGAAEDASEAIGANAYAQGNRIGFANAPDLHTAAHEAAHVVQQRHGHAPAGGLDTPGDALEKHADQVADAVVAGDSAEGLLDAMVDGGRETGDAAVQRKAKDDTPKSPAETRKLLQHYLYDNSQHVWQAVGEHMRSVQFPTPRTSSSARRA